MAEKRQKIGQPDKRRAILDGALTLFARDGYTRASLDAIAAAKARGIVTILDNTWATPLFFPAIGKGIDLTVLACTKYVVGHSDVMLGTVSANAATVAALRNTVRYTGLHEAPDDTYLALRGLRTLGIRLDRHFGSGVAVARWLEQRPEVLRMLHPALESHPGHALWQRDFTGASGLFSMVLKPVPQKAYYAFLDTLELFGIGYSWGGFESLAIPFDPVRARSATPWPPAAWQPEDRLGIRLSIGLEDPADLIADLERGFAAMAAG